MSTYDTDTAEKFFKTVAAHPLTEKIEERDSAEFCPVDTLNHFEEACSECDLLSHGFAAGLPGITQVMVEEAAKIPAQILAELCETYPPEAVRKGSIKHRYNLPQHFSNESGVEVTEDPEATREVIREMAAARGQVLK